MQGKRDVRFIGGPFDGYCQPMSHDTSGVLPVALIPVCRDTFRLLGDEFGEGSAIVTSFAVYRLEKSPSTWRYRFLRALDPAKVWTKRRRSQCDERNPS